jgi:hypothetical protein
MDQEILLTSASVIDKDTSCIDWMLQTLSLSIPDHMRTSPLVSAPLGYETCFAKPAVARLLSIGIRGVLLHRGLADGSKKCIQRG